MRTFLLLLIALTLAFSARAQDDTFADFRRQIGASEGIVEETAEALAEAKQYLRDVSPMADPTALIAGDGLLHIGGVSFVLYLCSVDGHTEARLQSQELRIGEAAKREATAFLEVATRAVARG